MRLANAEVLRYLPALYGARDFEALTDAAFRVLQAAVSCHHVSVFYRSDGTQLMLERDSLGRTFGPEFTRRHGELTPAIRLGLASPGIKLLPTKTGLPLSEAELRRTDLYREVMQVQGWRHAVALCIWDEKAMQFPLLVFSVKRQEGEEDFSDADLSALEAAHECLELAVRRFHEDASAQAVFDALAAPLRHDRRAVAIVNWRFEVVRSNSEGRRIVSGEPEIGAMLMQVCRQLDAVRLRLIGQNPSRRILRRRCELSITGAVRRSATVTMMCRDAEPVAKPSFVLQIANAERSAPDGQHFHVPEGLTAAERQVALTAAEGLSTQEIADRLSKSLGSVKFLLHRVYAKTGVGNRSGLVALIRRPPERDT